MSGKRELRAGIALSAMALGTNFASGRSLAAFYAQLGETSWLGIAVSTLIFGAFMGMIARLARRCGARSMLEVLKRAPGGGFGWMVMALYLLIAAGGICMMMASAAHIGALMLPMRHAGAYAASLCLLLSAAAAFRGVKAMRMLGGMFYVCGLLFVVLLLFSGKLPDGALVNWALDLRLRNNVCAALLFALLHASTMVCMAAGAAVRMTDGRVRPGALGLWSGGALFLLLALGNAALRVRADEMLVLRLPFVALSSGWGLAGFYMSGCMIFLAAVCSASALLFAVIPQHKYPDFG